MTIPLTVVSPEEFVRLTPSLEREFTAVGVRGGTGVKSQAYMCLKDDDDTYIWVALTGDAFPLKGVIAYEGFLEDLPDGWFLCDGNNGTPDLRNLFIVGAGDDYEIGDTGGADSVTLTTAQMPQHNHGDGSLQVSIGPHVHQVISPAAVGPNTDLVVGGGLAGVWNGGPNVANTTPAGETSTVVTGSTSNAGSGQAHENRPPYYALAWIMRVE